MTSFSWTDICLDDIPQVPGMTQPDELKYFYWCCATQHQAGRRVVELGPYVGRSTMAMAAGLRQSAEPLAKMVSVDRFAWEPWTLENSLRYTIGGLSAAQRARLSPRQLEPQEGDSFLPFFEIFTEPLKDSIEAVNTRLESYLWTGEPIDVLMIDAAKSWPVLDQIVRQFFPCLVNGATVIHQDYKHFYTYWLHPVTERMLERGVLTLAENIEGHPSQGFRFHKSGAFSANDYVQSAFTDEELCRLMRQSAGRFRGDHEKLALVGANCRLLRDQGQADRAKLIFAAAIREGGFSDNYALDDLLMIAHNWAIPLRQSLLERVIPPTNMARATPIVRAIGPNSIALPTATSAKPTVAEFAAVETPADAEVALNFWASRRAKSPLHIRIQVFDASACGTFFDDEFVMSPGCYQPAIISLGNRSKFAMRWTAWSEGPLEPANEIHCIAPMLII
jgi:hypothetical protein